MSSAAGDADGGTSGSSLPTLSWDPIVSTNRRPEPPREPDPAPPVNGSAVNGSAVSGPAANDLAVDRSDADGASAAAVAPPETSTADPGRISFDLQLDLGGAAAAPEPQTPASPQVVPPPPTAGPSLQLGAAANGVAPEGAIATPQVDALPPIREATPVEPLPEVPSATLSAEPAVPVLAPEAAAAPAPGAAGEIRLPPTHQPDQSQLARVAPIAAAVAPAPAAPVRKKRRGRGLIALFFVLLLLGGVVAAAIIVGRPMLFPDASWDAEVEPYAIAIEEVRGDEFVETLTATREPATAFEARSAAELLGEWEDDLAVWRALALANGGVTADSVNELVGGGPDALYSTTDGQVYQRSGVTGAVLDAATTAALAQAAVDQDVRWSTEQEARTLDAAAFVTAAVGAESESILASTAFDAPLGQREPARMAFLPPVLAYRALAPMTYVGVLPDDLTVDAATMERFALVGDTTVTSSSAPQLVAGDVDPGDVATPDRSFWYLALGAYLDRDTAYAASQAVVESSLTAASDGNRVCVYGTFTGGAVDATGVLRAALDQWAAAAPVEFGAQVATLPNGALQLRTCDPGAGFENGARFGVANELIGYRAAELATLSTLLAAGGTDAEIEAALGRLAASGVPAQLAATSADTAPGDAAAGAVAAVGPIVTPPPAEPVQPEPAPAEPSEG